MATVSKYIMQMYRYINQYVDRVHACMHVVCRVLCTRMLYIATMHIYSISIAHTVSAYALDTYV